MKYLFTAEFDNGFVYQQNDRDISTQDKNLTCFGEILQFMKQHNTKLLKFSLINQTNTVSYTVNLLNGEIVMLHGHIKTTLLPPQERLMNFRVIYFRRSEVKLNLQPDHKAVSGQPFVRSYIIGWQAIDNNGHNKQTALEIEG